MGKKKDNYRKFHHKPKPTDENPDKIWTRARKALLISLRLKYEDRFTKKKNKKMWKIILKEIQEEEPEFPFTAVEICKKFFNTMVMYRKAKKRKDYLSKKGDAFLVYYRMLDEVYGNRETYSTLD